VNQGGDRIPQASHSDLEEDHQPGILTMIGLVALVVAVVILVFFGIGYLFGRLFL
jgi:type IV secretory pathway VirB2 component (pilin)